MSSSRSRCWIDTPGEHDCGDLATFAGGENDKDDQGRGDEGEFTTVESAGDDEADDEDSPGTSVRNRQM